MSERIFDRLRIKSKEVSIDGVPLKLYGLTFPELSEMVSLLEKQKTQEGMQYLLKISLRKSIPESEMNTADFEDFVKNISSESALQIIQTVKDISGLRDVEKKVQEQPQIKQ